MKKILIKEIKKFAPAFVGIVATFLSLFVFIFQFMGLEYNKVAIGVLGALVGGFIAFIIGKLQNAINAPKVFISYTQGDREFAHKLAAALEQFPVNVLLDTHELRVGDNINEKINELVSNSTYFLFVISRESIQSKWANKELEKAIEMKKRILPVITGPIEPPDMLKGIVYANFTSSFEEGIEQLRLTLKDYRHNKSLKRYPA
jgi:hypothetical protein